LLQGGGIDFNRIAGPNGTPGFYNGVLIARVNTDISLADFELGLRDLVSNVENTYWDLYYAYRDLDTKISARNSSLETWRRVQALNVTGRRGGEAEKEAEAREQYFRFEEDVQNAYTGRLLDGTRTNNGSSGGTPRGIGGVRVVERRLRLLMGVPITDMRLIRPADEPKLSKVVFDWEEILPEALARRAEIRRQKWIIKKRELELVASRNFLLPSFDVYGIQRWRGFGHDLLNPERQPSQFDNAYQNLTTGNFQEWELGAEFSMPIGYRQGYAALRNAQLQLSRDRSVLEQQEREVSHDISNSVGDMDRAYEIAQTGFNRRVAARQQLDAVQAAYDAERVQLDLLLEAQRRLAEADSRFFFALSEYAIAVKNVHFEKGSLLDFNEIYLSEGPWPGKAYSDASRRDAHTRDAGRLNYIFKQQQPPVSAGPVGRPVPNFSPVGHPGPQPESIKPVPVDALPPGTPQPEPLPRPNSAVLAPAPYTMYTPSTPPAVPAMPVSTAPMSGAPITAAPQFGMPVVAPVNRMPQGAVAPPPYSAPMAAPAVEASPRPQPVIPQPAQMSAAGITPIYYGPQPSATVPLPPLANPSLAPTGPPQSQPIMPATSLPPTRQAGYP
jgi:outer membrane protein TolC